METSKVLDIIDARIQKYEDEIESFEMSDTSFVNGKRIKEIGGLIRELKSLKAEITTV